MEVRLVWPDCDFVNGEWVLGHENSIDSFWLQCTEHEAELFVNSRVTLLLAFGDCQPAPEEFGLPICFLVSRDLTSIIRMGWVYPHSGQWGADSPFRQLKKAIQIDKLEDISNIAIPREFR